MLGQIELDRGPQHQDNTHQKCPVTANNCWAGGNAGEMDFLEPAFIKGKANDTAVRSQYQRCYGMDGWSAYVQ